MRKAPWAEADSLGRGAARGPVNPWFLQQNFPSYGCKDSRRNLRNWFHEIYWWPILTAKAMVGDFAHEVHGPISLAWHSAVTFLPSMLHFPITVKTLQDILITFWSKILRIIRTFRFHVLPVAALRAVRRAAVCLTGHLRTAILDPVHLFIEPLQHSVLRGVALKDSEDSEPRAAILHHYVYIIIYIDNMYYIIIMYIYIYM